ncbi:unnamed protein product [Schistosoma rodhaini]|uniref:Uncharacterized protein n=1 Tax=Schistosoma rodhaini TaxID=6188 RepID=A0AA85FUR9_9TREM|nr:unnamed protein product [Schistosoma rodhaini]CAH8569489.1 unnamed protein product [Schistosoma rodhaini]
MCSSSVVFFGDNFDHNQWNGKCEDTCHIGYSSKSEQFESQLEAMNSGELSSVGDLELQLSACNRIVSLLCNRLSTGYFQQVQLLNNLNQCGDSLSVTLSTLLKHDYFVNLNQSRVKGAEEEAIMAMDQLKAKRANLKATIEGLDEQVALPENSLYERTQELHKCQTLLVKYCPTYQKPVTPYFVGPEVPTSELSIKIHEPNNNYTSEPAVFNLRDLQSFEPKESFLRSPSIKFKFLYQLRNGENL